MKVGQYTVIKLMASPWDDHADAATIYKSFRILKLIKP